MSRTFSSSMPLDMPHPGTSGTRLSRLLDLIRGYGRLVWIEFRRCGGYWMLPLILPLVWYMNQWREENGVVFWSQMSIVTFQSYVIIGPLTAGLTTWLAGRDRRRLTGGLIETAPMRTFHRDLILLGAGATWGLVAYVIVGSWYLGRAVLFATWGGPDLGWLAVGALAIVVHAALGYLIGRVIRGRFAALVAVALPIGLAIGADAYHRITEVDMGNGMGMTTSYEQPLRNLSPFSLSMSLGFHDGIVRTENTYVPDTGLWLLGLLGVMLATIALVRHRRSLASLVGLGAALVVTTMGAYTLLDGQESWSEEGGFRFLSIEPFEWSCQSGSGVKVCLHPAYEARLDDITRTMGALLAPITGLRGVPTLWQQFLPTDIYHGDPGGVGGLHAVDNYSLVSSLTDGVFSTRYEERNGAQFVVIAALAEQAGISPPEPWMFGVPSEVKTMGSDGFLMLDESNLAALEATMDAAVDRFTALSPEEQRAWLEANWDVLRTGELPLEEMP